MKTKILLAAAVISIAVVVHYKPRSLAALWEPGKVSRPSTRFEEALNGNISGANSTGGGLLVVSISLEPQAFKGASPAETRRSVEDFVSQLGAKMAGYNDSSAIRSLKLVPLVEVGPVGAILGRLRVGGALKDLPGVKVFTSPGGGVWDVDLKEEVYPEQAEKMFSGVTGKYGLRLRCQGAASCQDAGSLEIQVPADPNGPIEYASALAARAPGRIKQATVYRRTQKPDGTFDTELYVAR